MTENEIPRYTPDLQVVKDAYVTYMRDAFVASTSELEAEFDRFIETINHLAWTEGHNHCFHVERPKTSKKAPYKKWPLGQPKD